MNVIRLLDEHPLTSPVADRRLGAAPGADRGRRGDARGVHGRHRQVRRRDRRRARHEAQGRPHPAREPRPVPGLRPRHHGEPQGLLVLVARGPGLRLRDLEGQGRQADAAGGRHGADPHRPHREAGHRLQGPQRPLVPRQARARAERRGQVARRVRRAVGQGGRTRGRGRRGRGRRGGGRRRPAAPQRLSRAPELRRRVRNAAAAGFRTSDARSATIAG